MVKHVISLAIVIGLTLCLGCVVARPNQSTFGPLQHASSDQDDDCDDGPDLGGVLVDAIFWAITGDDQNDDCCCKKCRK